MVKFILPMYGTYNLHRNWVLTPTCNLANSSHKDINKIVHIVGGVTIGWFQWENKGCLLKGCLFGRPIFRGFQLTQSLLV